MKIILTHDADSIGKPFRHIWQRRNRFSAGDLIRSALKIRNLYNNIEGLTSLEESFGFHSTFFIPTFLFDIEEVSDTLKSIRNSGWEVQLHYVHNPTQSEGLFRLQKEYFEHKIGLVEGIRTHNLEITGETLEMFEKGEIVYDSSYRRETVGTYDVYRVKGNLMEIPLGIMDTDIFGRLMLDENDASRYIMWKIREAREEKARSFSILFHQESYRMKGGRLYKNLIEYLANRGYEVQRCIDAVRSAGRNSD